MDPRTTKQIFGFLAVSAGVGYLYYRSQEKKTQIQKMNPSLAGGVSPHQLIDAAMGFVKMNPIAKAVFTQGLKKAIPEEQQGDVIDADYEVL